MNLGPKMADPDDLAETASSDSGMALEWRLTYDILHAVLRLVGNVNVLPLIHVMLVFFWQLSLTPQGQAYIDRYLDFRLLTDYLNALVDKTEHNSQLAYLSFPSAVQGQDQPLPEDYLLRGQIYAQPVYPYSWFENATSDMDERSIEQDHMPKQRIHRVKWVAVQLSVSGKQDASSASNLAEQDNNADEKPPLEEPSFEEGRRWIGWNPTTDKFSVVSKYSTTRQARVSQSSYNPANSAEADHGGHASNARHT